MTITLRSLVSLRWVLIVLVALGQLLIEALAASEVIAGTGLPRVESRALFAGATVAWTMHNGWIWFRLRSQSEASWSERDAGLHLLIDTTVLSLAFLSAGAASNPFTAIYFVPIVLATQVSPRWTWFVGIYTALAFASLFLLQGEPPGGGGPHAAHFAMHLRGMWIAFAVSGGIMTLFVHRIALNVAAQRSELARIRAEALEDRHLAAIGTLAAGAAHELGTPLATVGVLAEELALMDASEREEAAQTIGRELERCKTIVQRMSSPELRADQLRVGDEPWPVVELAGVVERLMADSEREAPVRVDPKAQGMQSTLVRAGVEQILRELVSNAIRACAHAAGSKVEFELEAVGLDAMRFCVCDDGPGMKDEERARVFEPFYSEGDHAGTGLGLYLVRAQVRQLGGTVLLESQPGVGSRVGVELPLHARRDEESRG